MILVQEGVSASQPSSHSQGKKKKSPAGPFVPRGHHSRPASSLMSHTKTRLKLLAHTAGRARDNSNATAPLEWMGKPTTERLQEFPSRTTGGHTHLTPQTHSLWLVISDDFSGYTDTTVCSRWSTPPIYGKCLRPPRREGVGATSRLEPQITHPGCRLSPSV